MATSRSQRILQNFLLVWLDANMNEKEHFFQNFIGTITTIRSISQYIYQS